MADEYDPLEALFTEPKNPADQAGDNTGAADQGAEGNANTGSQTQTPVEAPLETGEEAEPKMVPIEALHEARRRAKDAEDRLAARDKPVVGEERAEAGEPSAAELFGERPDPKEDLDGYLAWQQGVNNFNLLNQTINISERMARKDHGEELVGKVREWALAKFETDPAFTQQVLGDPDPYDVAIRLYNQAEEAKQLQGLPEEVRKGLTPDELELLRAHRAKNASGDGDNAGANGGHSQPRDDTGQFKAAVPGKRSPQAPSGSIANTRGSGKASDPMHRATGPGVAVDDAFGPG